MKLLVVAICLLLAFGAPAGAADIVSGKAEVTPEQELMISDAVLRLYDVVLPQAGTACFELRGRRDEAYPCHLHARAALQSLIAGEDVSCVRRNGGAICYVRGEDVAETLVSLGWAVSCAQTSRYVLHQENARLARKGLWAGHFDMKTICPKTQADPSP